MYVTFTCRTRKTVEYYCGTKTKDDDENPFKNIIWYFVLGHVLKTREDSEQANKYVNCVDLEMKVDKCGYCIQTKTTEMYVTFRTRKTVEYCGTKTKDDDENIILWQRRSSKIISQHCQNIAGRTLRDPFKTTNV